MALNNLKLIIESGSYEGLGTRLSGSYSQECQKRHVLSGIRKHLTVPHRIFSQNISSRIFFKPVPVFRPPWDDHSITGLEVDR